MHVRTSRSGRHDFFDRRPARPVPDDSPDDAVTADVSAEIVGFSGLFPLAHHAGMHVAHQLFDVGSVGETGGQFRVRIVLRGRTAHGHQAAILRFFPGPVMHAAPCGRPRHDPAAVHGHGGQAGSLGIGALRVCSACAVACCSRCSRNSCPIMPLRSMISGTLIETSANFHNIFWALPADLCSALAETILSSTAGL